jgi:cell division protease FtsH
MVQPLVRIRCGLEINGGKLRGPQLTDIIEALTPQETRSPSDLRSIALHEIGHIVVAQRLGHRVDSVSIIPNGPSEGHTIARAPTIVPTRQHLQELVMIGMGGRAADIVVDNGSVPGTTCAATCRRRVPRLILYPRNSNPC